MIRSILLLTLLLMNTQHTYPDDTIYNWTDEGNVRHFTNQKQKAVDSAGEKVKVFKFTDKDRERNTAVEFNIPDPEEDKNTSPESLKEKEELRRIWRSRMENIENRIEQTEGEILAIENRMEYLEEEIDYLLINGYSADYMIFELKTLQNGIEPLKNRIDHLEEEKEALRTEARKKGIPPGYLRP